MSEYKSKSQVNYGWNLTWKATGRFPIIADRIFETLAEAQAFVDDTTSSATATPGIIISVIKDETEDNNGIYYVKSVAENTGEKGVLIKSGGADNTVVWEQF